MSPHRATCRTLLMALLLGSLAPLAQAAPAPGCPPTDQPQPRRPLMHALEHRPASMVRKPLVRGRPAVRLAAATPEIRYAMRCDRPAPARPQV